MVVPPSMDAPICVNDVESGNPLSDATVTIIPADSEAAQAYIKREFDEHGWLFAQQPSQSPLTNIKDCCLFPALSKLVLKFMLWLV